MKEQVEKVIENIRPMLMADGGDIELISVDEATGKVTVSLMGACGCCPHAIMTLKAVVEARLKKEVPGVTEVIRA
ncbi:MAG: NifU family protein [Elusimicrobiaceae bacterium]